MVEILAHILKQTRADLHNPKFRDDALVFLKSYRFERICNALGLDENYTRAYITNHDHRTAKEKVVDLLRAEPYLTYTEIMDKTGAYSLAIGNAKRELGLKSKSGLKLRSQAR